MRTLTKRSGTLPLCHSPTLEPAGAITRQSTEDTKVNKETCSPEHLGAARDVGRDNTTVIATAHSQRRAGQLAVSSIYTNKKQYNEVIQSPPWTHQHPAIPRKIEVTKRSKVLVATSEPRGGACLC